MSIHILAVSFSGKGPDGSGRSIMHSSLRLARWSEASSFTLIGGRLIADQFDMRTRVLLSRKRYSTKPAKKAHSEALNRLLDRQTAIIEIARKAALSSDDNLMEIPFIDERGNLKNLHLDHAGTLMRDGLKALEVFFWFEDSPGEYVHALMAKDYPGLIIAAQVYGDGGEKLLTLTLNSWSSR